MSSTNKTTNYELSQFQSNDIPAWLTDYNGDMQKIDAGIHAAKTQAQSAANGVAALQTAVSGKQDALTFDTTPINGSNNPVTSGGIYNALQNVSVQTDAVPTEGSTKAVQSGGVFTALQGKQNSLTFDSAPTQNSQNPVTSGGVYSALQSGGAIPEILSVTPSGNSGVFGQAIKIGKLVIVSFCGYSDSTGNDYIVVNGVTKSIAPTQQYAYALLGSNPSVKYISDSDITNSGGNTRIDVGAKSSNLNMTNGTVWFICN